MPISNNTYTWYHDVRPLSEKNAKFMFGPLLFLEFALLLGPIVAFSANLTWHDQQRIEQIILLYLLTLGSFFIWRVEVADIWGRFPRWVSLSLVLGLGLGLVSVLSAEYPRYAGLEWASLTLLAWCAVVLGGQSLGEGVAFDRWATRAIVLAAIFISLKTMIIYWVALSADIFDIRKLFSLSFNSPRFFGQAASMLLPILAYPLLTGRLTRPKAGATFLLLAVWWMLAIASGTRGTWLAMLTAAGILALVSWRASQSWLRVQTVACLVGLGLFAVFILWLPEIAQQHGMISENRLRNITSLSKREEIWALAWQQMRDHPWLGIGPMHLAAIKNSVAAHPHNALLQLGAEWGLLATLALVTPLIYAMGALLSRIRKQHNDSNDPLLVCLGASLLAATTQSMVDGVIVMPYSQTLLVFVCGWTVGAYFRAQETAETPDFSRVKWYAIYLVPIFALGLMAWGIFPEILNREEITRQLLNSGVTYFYPRYWVHGWIP